MPGALWDTTGRAAHTLPRPSECPADQPPFPVSDPCTVPPASPLPPLHPAAVGDAPVDWRACSAPRRSLSAHQVSAQPPLVCAVPALQISANWLVLRKSCVCGVPSHQQLFLLLFRQQRQVSDVLIGIT